MISIVIPIFNEEKNVRPLFERLKAVFDKQSIKWELIFVDDGSQDGSVMEISGLAKKNKNVKAVFFSRNFGKEVALSAGCRYARGEAVITMDGDLQHPPELIPEILEKWRNGGEVVYTVRKENQGAGALKKLTSGIYWWLFGKISTLDSEPHSTDFRLMDRRVVDEINRFSERGRIFRGIVDWTGFKREKMEFSAEQRRNEKAGYSYKKLFHLGVNSLTAFSLLPLKVAGFLGVLITSVSSLLFIVMIIVRWFIEPKFFSSLSFVVVINTVLIGIVLSCLGMIALYIARIHDEVTGRPLYIVRKKINIDE
ncbi:MAG: glycosyltransferase family 2 protein [Candidatus Moranbacteria bacterium]|nr:glycosyltransferase family 2 protein [Candidatus Moranbacteria bacterium]